MCQDTCENTQHPVDHIYNIESFSLIGAKLLKLQAIWCHQIKKNKLQMFAIFLFYSNIKWGTN